jgi:hypothetical protein
MLPENRQLCRMTGTICQKVQVEGFSVIGKRLHFGPMSILTTLN